jgi:FAD/FMN-containing dehydrogenase
LIELCSAADEDLDGLLRAALGSSTAQALIGAAVIARNERERQEFWQLRESIPELQRRLGASIKHDVALPLQALPEFIGSVQAWVDAQVPDGQLICYGHVGDGNLHCNVSQRAGSDAERFLAQKPRVNRAVHDLVQALGGSISAEHGIGQLKVTELARYASPTKLALMRQLKRALDPQGIMNPGKLL